MDKKAKALLKKHWKPLTAAIIACIIAIIGAGTVLIWFIQTSDIGAQGTLTIDQWSLATVLWFMLNLGLWELLFIGIPALIIFGGGGYLWWNRLSAQDKKSIKGRDKKHSNDGGDAFEFFFFIAYVIYIAIQGNFYTPFGNLPYSYWIYSCIWTIVWLGIIIGIPGGIIGLLYCGYCKTKPAKKKTPKRPVRKTAVKKKTATKKKTTARKKPAKKKTTTRKKK